MYGVGLSISRSQSSRVASINATVPPVLGTLSDAQTPAQAFTPGSYASSAGGISQTVTFFVNGLAVAGNQTLVPGDTVFVRETVEDADGQRRTFLTVSRTVEPSTPLGALEAPQVSGDALVGRTLTASQGSWAGSAPRTYQYEWLRGDQPISQATLPSYLVREADRGSTLLARVTATDGFSQIAQSSAATQAVRYPAPTASGALADLTLALGQDIGTVNLGADFDGFGLSYTQGDGSGALPQGLLLSASGILSGRPEALVSSRIIVIRATDPDGQFTESAFSVTVAGVPDQIASPLLASAEGALSVTRPEPPADNNAPITSYDLRFGTDGTAWTLVQDVPTPYEIAGLQNDQTYTVQLRANNAIGSGPWSQSATAAPGSSFDPSAYAPLVIIDVPGQQGNVFVDGPAGSIASPGDPVGLVLDARTTNDVWQAIGPVGGWTFSGFDVASDLGGGAFTGTKSTAGGNAIAISAQTFAAEYAGWYRIDADFLSLPGEAQLQFTSGVNGRSTVTIATEPGLVQAVVSPNIFSGSFNVGIRTADTHTIDVEAVQVSGLAGPFAGEARAGHQPVLQSSGAMAFDGGNGKLFMPLPGGSGPADASLFLAVKTSDPQFALARGHSNAFYFGVAAAGDTSTLRDANAGAVSYVVDGSNVPGTRADLHAAMAGGTFVCVEVRGLNLVSWKAIYFSAYSSWAMQGELGGRILLLDNAAPEAASLDRAALRSWILEGLS